MFECQSVSRCAQLPSGLEVDLPDWLRRLSGEGIRFGLVGICATLTYLGVSLVVQRLWGQPLTSSSLGYLASVGISYAGHRSFTFETERPHLTTGPRFLAVSLCGFVLTNLIVAVITEFAGLPFALAAALVAIVIPLFNWVLSRLWVFGPRE